MQRKKLKFNNFKKFYKNSKNYLPTKGLGLKFALKKGFLFKFILKK